MAAQDGDEEHSEQDDYFHGFHAAKQSIALTREFFDQRHEYLLDAISSPRGSPRKARKHKKKKSKSKDKHRDKHKHKHKHKKDKKRDSNKANKNKTIRDEVSTTDTYYVPLEIKEKGWRKHQSIATSAAIANNQCDTTKQKHKSSTSSSKRSHKNHKSRKKKQHATKQHNTIVNYHSDSDDFGVFDIADFAKQMQSKPNKRNSNEKKKTKEQRKLEKKQRKKEKKRLDRERKRKEREIEEIERKMYNKSKHNDISNASPNKKEFKFAYKPKYRTSGTYQKPSVNTNEINKRDSGIMCLNSSQTSPATAAAFAFDNTPNITRTDDKDQVIDTEDFHIVVVGQKSKYNTPASAKQIPQRTSLKIIQNSDMTVTSNISPSALSNMSATPSVPCMPTNLPEPPSSQAPFYHEET
eukprot:515482_1